MALRRARFRNNMAGTFRIIEEEIVDKATIKVYWAPG